MSSPSTETLDFHIPSTRPSSPSRASPEAKKALQCDTHNFSTLAVTRRHVFHGQESNVVAFNRHTHELIMRYNRHSRFVTCTRYFNLVVYTGSQDGLVISWNVKTGKPLAYMEGHSGPVTYLLVAPATRYGAYNRAALSEALFSSSWDGTIRQWDLDTGLCNKTYRVGQKSVERFQVFEGLVYAGSGDQFKVFNVETGTLIFQHSGGAEKLHHAMRYHSETRQLIIGGTSVTVWKKDDFFKDDAKPTVVASYEFVESEVQDDGNSFRPGRTAQALPPADGAEEKKVRKTKPDHIRQRSVSRLQRRPSKFSNKNTKVNHITLADEGFWTGHADGSVRKWDISLHRKLGEAHVHKGPITAMVLWHNLLCTASTDMTVTVYDRSTTQQLFCLRGHKAEIISIRRFRGMLYTSSVDHDIRQWNLRDDLSYEGIYKGSAALISAMYLDDDNRLFFGNSEGLLCVWDLTACRMLMEVRVAMEPTLVTAIVPIGEGRLVVATEDDAAVFSLEGIRKLCTTKNPDPLYLPLARPEQALEGVSTEVGSAIVHDNFLYISDMKDIHYFSTETLRPNSFNVTAKSGHRLGGSPIKMALGTYRNKTCLFSTCASDMNLTVWDLNGERLHSRRLSAPGSAVAYDPHYGLVFVAVGIEGEAHNIQSFDANSFEAGRKFSFHSSNVETLVVRGKYLFSGGADQQCVVWDIETAETVTVIQGHYNTVASIVVSDDLIVHSGSDQIKSNDLPIFLKHGITLQFRVSAGRAGLFGAPIDSTEVELERDRMNRNTDAPELDRMPSPHRTRRVQTITVADTVLGNEVDWRRMSSWHEIEQGDDEKDIPAPRIDIREYHSPAQKKLKKTHALYHTYFMGFFLCIMEFLQLASFAFTVGMGINGVDRGVVLAGYDFEEDNPYPGARGLVNFFLFIQSFAISSGDNNYDFRLAGGGLLVVIFWFTLLTQESLEWKKFLFPSNRRVKRTWFFADQIVKLMTWTFFLPVAATFVLSFSCTNDEDIDLCGSCCGVNDCSGCKNGVCVFARVGWIWDADATVECYKSSHLARCVVGAFALVFYFLPALRLLRVGSELWRVELVANPMDWRRDELNREYNYPLSLSSSMPDVWNLSIKLAFVVCAVALTNNADVQAFFYLLLAIISCWINYVRPPYFSEKYTRVRMCLHWILVWLYVIALNVQLTKEDRPDDNMGYYLWLAIPLVGWGGYQSTKIAPACPGYRQKKPTNRVNAVKKGGRGRMTILLSRPVYGKADPDGGSPPALPAYDAAAVNEQKTESETTTLRGNLEPSASGTTIELQTR